MWCKVIELVLALNCVAGFPRRNQKAADEEVRSTTAADVATKHCARLYWNEEEQRKLSWPSLPGMEAL